MVQLSFPTQGSLPVVDMARFRGPFAERVKLAREVDVSCRETGFLVIANHGVDLDLIARVDAIGRRFFDLDDATKAACTRRQGGITRGYSEMRSRALARTFDDAKAPNDLRETFTMGRPSRPADGDRDAGNPLFLPNIFPPLLPDMQPTLEAYYAAMSTLAAEIMRLFAMALKLDEYFFAPMIGQHVTNLSITNYPDLAAPPEPGQLRAGAHTDFGMLTILRAEDKPGGLEIQNADGTWQRVPIAPDCFVINIGDLMARWTNDLWRSTVHRVANPPPEATGSSRRLSIIFFFQPDHDAEIQCLPSCIGDGARYMPTTSGAHMLEKMTRSLT